jgi:hypothetical protein
MLTSTARARYLHDHKLQFLEGSASHSISLCPPTSRVVPPPEGTSPLGSPPGGFFFWCWKQAEKQSSPRLADPELLLRAPAIEGYDQSRSLTSAWIIGLGDAGFFAKRDIFDQRNLSAFMSGHQA